MTLATAKTRRPAKYYIPAAWHSIAAKLELQGAEPKAALQPRIDTTRAILAEAKRSHEEEQLIKRFERQIPVTLADDTSAITTEPFDDSYPIGVDRAGRLFGPTDGGVSAPVHSQVAAATMQSTRMGIRSRMAQV